MIEALRFVKRHVPAPEFGPNTEREIKILQYSDGYEWRDVPLVDDAETNKENK